MLLLQLSSAQGPDECCLAVAKALQRLQQEAIECQVKLTILEQELGSRKHTLRSVLVMLEGVQEKALADQWCGTIQWICPSPYRPSHGRKNWFIGGAIFEPPTINLASEVRFETMRSSGAGGQHVNKTDSAVRATHLATGISVKVQSERSQHANKRLALLLIAKKLQEQMELAQAESKAERRMLHHQLARGNPIRVFRQMVFS